MVSRVLALCELYTHGWTRNSRLLAVPCSIRKVLTATAVRKEGTFFTLLSRGSGI